MCPLLGSSSGTGVEIDGGLIFIIEVNRRISGLIVLIIINLLYLYSCNQSANLEKTNLNH